MNFLREIISFPSIAGKFLKMLSLSRIIPASEGKIMENKLQLDASKETLILLCKDLGQLIKSSRKAAHIPIDQAALLAGVSKQFLSDLEHGKPTLQFEKALMVAQKFGIELFARPRGLAAMQRAGEA